MLVNGKWVPTFPQARYLFGREEYDYWSSQTDDETVPIMNDSVNPVFEAGLVDLVEMDHQLCKEVSLEPTPGHTPGHVSVRITSEGQEALITGDSFHHPCQIAHPEWCCAIDYSKEGSKLTREKMLEKYSANGTLIIGTHFATPTAGYFKKKGEGYILEVFEKE
jgi:glyoxylase-like metal-dependent hydrolase (beta-lactamase superfamily II)